MDVQNLPWGVKGNVQRGAVGSGHLNQPFATKRKIEGEEGRGLFMEHP